MYHSDFLRDPYRYSPFSSDGISFKLEYRKYAGISYRSFQLMYKYSYYKEAVYTCRATGNDVAHGEHTITESKYSSVIGLGYFLGLQKQTRHFVFDWYGGIGIRYRVINFETMKVEYENRINYGPYKQTVKSFYPFINLGLRLGYNFTGR
jgi:hypothetical protein